MIFPFHTRRHRYNRVDRPRFSGSKSLLGSASGGNKINGYKRLGIDKHITGSGLHDEVHSWSGWRRFNETGINRFRLFSKSGISTREKIEDLKGL